MISPFDNPPFAPEPTCSSCGKPWILHDGITRVCRDNQNLLTVLKATAINTLEIHQMLVKVIEAYENPPQTPKVPKANDSDLQGN